MKVTARHAIGSLLLVSALLVVGFLVYRHEHREQLDARGKSPAAGATTSSQTPWFSGDLEHALAEAKANRRPMFIYWGAAWCPPCNRLKWQVFSNPRFGDVMKRFVLVSIDGDEPLAQTFGERYSAFAYPSMVIVSSENRELFRIAQFVDFDELESVILALGDQERSLESALQHLESGDISNPEWRLLAYADWAQLPPRSGSILQRLNWLQKAWESCPRALRKERSLLAMSLLSMALTNDGAPEFAAVLAWVRSEGLSLFDSMFVDEEAVWASRLFLATWTKPSMLFMFGDNRGEPYQALKRRWLDAASLVRQHKGAPAEIRLLTMGASLDMHGLEYGDIPVNAQLRREVEQAVRDALEQAANDIERQAIVSHCAFYLRKLGDMERARAMLEEQSQKSDWPWYYQSTLSAMESQLGNMAKAREWSSKARRSARGSASRIQWIVNDLVLLSKQKDSTSKDELLLVAEEYYEAATGLEDGFWGRNASRAAEVVDALSAWSRDDDFLRLFSRYAARCEKLEQEARNRCALHFEKMREPATR